MRVMRMKRRVAIVGSLGLGLLLIIALTNDELMRDMQMLMIFQTPDMDVSCYKDDSIPDYSFPRFDQGKDGPRLSSGRNIFFHETSCFGEGKAELNCRQACAVESAARANPNLSVNLLFLSPSPPSNKTRKIIDRLVSYKNVKVLRILVDDYIKNTPLEKWFTDGVLGSSHWPRSHMSDIMRYLTLWKFGGIYLDLDVVVTKSLEDLSDFAGAEDHLSVAAGVIGFSASDLGRRMADACIRDLIRNYRGNRWGNNGPGVITRTLKQLCSVEHAMDMYPERCSGFRVFPPICFYPIYYEEWQRYFTEEEFNDTMRLIEQARAIHVWNKLSGEKPIRVGSKVPYAIVAQKHCPKVYNGCGDIF